MAISPFQKNYTHKLWLLLFSLCLIYCNPSLKAQQDIDSDEKIDSLIQIKPQKEKIIKPKKDWTGLVLGADYQLGIGSSIYVDFSPYIGYKLYDRVSFNLGIPYMYYYDMSFKESSHVVGARAFVRIRPAVKGFFRSFFVQGEGEYLKCYLGYNAHTTGPTRANTYTTSYIKAGASGFNIGLGYCSNFSNGFSATLLILYNLNYDNLHPVYLSPIVYRLGFMYAF